MSPSRPAGVPREAEVQIKSGASWAKMGAHWSSSRNNLDERFVSRWAAVGVLWGTAVARGEKTIIDDVRQHEPLQAAPTAHALRDAGVRGMNALPLVDRGGRPLGLLALHYRRPHRPAERSLRLLGLMARQAADLVVDAQRVDPSERT